MIDSNQYLTQAEALHEINPDLPPSAVTAKAWHDRVGGPRDSYGRRIWTPAVCVAIRRARAESRKASAA